MRLTRLAGPLALAASLSLSLAVPAFALAPGLAAEGNGPALAPTPSPGPSTGTPAGTKSETLAADKVFAFLSNYYSLAPQARSHFHMGYILMARSGSLKGVRLTLNQGLQKLPIQISDQGDLSPLPSLQQLKGTITIERPGDLPSSHFAVALVLTPSVQPQTKMEARALGLAVTEAQAGAKASAGVLGAFVPTFVQVSALGVSSGQVLLSNGMHKPLPYLPARTDSSGRAHPAQVMFRPDDFPDAAFVTFSGVPSRLMITPKD